MTYQIEPLCIYTHMHACVRTIRLVNSFRELNHDLFDQAFINYNEFRVYIDNCSIQTKLFVVF